MARIMTAARCVSIVCPLNRYDTPTALFPCYGELEFAESARSYKSGCGLTRILVHHDQWVPYLSVCLRTHVEEARARGVTDGETKKQ